MIIIDKTIYYYIILFAIFLSSFALIPLTFEIIIQKLTSNIPYSTLICLLLSVLIMLFVTITRRYYMHILFYVISLICLFIILFYKREYDKNNSYINLYELE